jgi:cytochrome c-type protein NapB
MRLSVLAGISALVVSTILTGLAIAQSSGSVQSLRTGEISETLPANAVHKQLEGRIKRNYRQQPPLIPHSSSQYQIDKRTNQCLGCHDWTVAGERGAPTLSMTHYLDRDGTQLDTVAGTRWFCNQCHVPQANAPELVGNDFKPSNALR